jgi:signal transduction histidine kinase
MLQTAKLDAAALARGLETIERNVKAQTQLIDDLLDISRIIRDKLRLDFKSVELAPVIEAALDSVRPMAALKEINLECQLDYPAGTIFGDADRLQQMIWNLLTNAIKFTPAGGRVTARLQRAQSHLEVSVNDTGKGVDPQFLPYVIARLIGHSSGKAHRGRS